MCTDNAAMVAAAGWWRLAHDGPSPLSLGPTPTCSWTSSLIDSLRPGRAWPTAGALRCGYAASEPSSRPHLPRHRRLVGHWVQLATELASRRLGVTLVARRAERLIELAATSPPGSVCAPSDRGRPRRGVLAHGHCHRGRRPRPHRGSAGQQRRVLDDRARGGAVRDRELAMVRTDVEAVVDLCTLFVPGMVERGQAPCSTSPRRPPSSRCPARRLRRLEGVRALLHRVPGGELKGTGVSATALCPGPVRTEFAETAGFGASEAEMGLPKVMWVSAEAVARAGIEGVEKNKAVVIPGAANSAGAVLSRLTRTGCWCRC